MLEVTVICSSRFYCPIDLTVFSVLVVTLWHFHFQMAPQDISHQMDNNVLNECNLLLRPQNNMNVSPSEGGNIKNQIITSEHDVNVNRVQSPLRSNSKYITTPYVIQYHHSYILFKCGFFLDGFMVKFLERKPNHYWDLELMAYF